MLQTSSEILLQLQKKEREQDILLCMAGKIAAARNRDELRDIVNQDLLNLFNAQYYTLCLLNEDGVTHTPFLHSDEQKIISRASESPIIHRQHPVNDGIFNTIVGSDHPVRYELRSLMQKSGAPAYVYHWYNAGVKHMLLTKVVNGRALKGVLYLYSKEEDAFAKDQFALLEGVADLLGAGICNILANEKIEQQMQQIEQYKQLLEAENDMLRLENQQEKRSFEILGTSSAIRQVEQMVRQVAQSDTTVLLTGETGTGKEVVARVIHHASSRNGKLMVKVNCAALPAMLIESELFGHEKGAFTGAFQRRIGKFELANEGTLFLDEIGELPLEAQAKLLRVLQEKEIERIGGTRAVKVNVRIIAATNRDLDAEVKKGSFRMDLFYRLHVFPIHLPPLRQRKEDIPLLAKHFLEKFAKQTGKKITDISKKTLESLNTYNWPGNIRELEHLIERSVLLGNAPILSDVQLPGKKQRIKAPGDTEVMLLDEVEKAHILKVIQLCKGRISGKNGAALKLGLPATTLISKMHKLGIRKEHFVAQDFVDP